MAEGILDRWLDDSIERSIQLLHKYILCNFPVSIKFVCIEQLTPTYNVYCYVQNRDLFSKSSDLFNSGEIRYNLAMAQILAKINMSRRFLLRAIAGSEIAAISSSKYIFLCDEGLTTHKNYGHVLEREYKELYTLWDSNPYYPMQPHDKFTKYLEDFGNPIYTYDFREMLIPVHLFIFSHELGHICMRSAPDYCLNIIEMCSDVYKKICSESNFSPPSNDNNWINEITADTISVCLFSQISNKE